MKTYYPLISIGITTFNRKKLLIETINSVLLQDFYDLEIIVGNDNLNRKVDEAFTGINDKRIKYVNNETNLGEWRNIQNLFLTSTGKYFCTIADDDLFSPTFFPTISNVIEKNNFPDCIFTSFTSKNDQFYKNKKIPNEKVYKSDFFFDKTLKFELKVIGNYGIIKSKKVKDLGGIPNWNSNRGHYSDIWLTMFFVSNFESIYYFDEKLIYYRPHLGSQSYAASDDKNWLECQIELIEKSYRLFESRFNNKKEEYTYIILKFYCLDNYYNRLIRTKTLTINAIYLLFLNIKPYFNLLGKYYYKFIFNYFKDTIKILLKLIFSSIKYLFFKG